MDAVKSVVSLVLTNVILYPYDMKDNTGSVALESLPVLNETVGKLRRAGANEQDIRDIVKLLSRNRKQDITRETQDNVRILVLLVLLISENIEIPESVDTGRYFNIYPRFKLKTKKNSFTIVFFFFLDFNQILRHKLHLALVYLDTNTSGYGLTSLSMIFEEGKEDGR